LLIAKDGFVENRFSDAPKSNEVAIQISNQQSCLDYLANLANFSTCDGPLF